MEEVAQVRFVHGRDGMLIGIAPKRQNEDGDLPNGEVSDAAARAHRYSPEALPLHVREEEESTLPRRGLAWAARS